MKLEASNQINIVLVQEWIYIWNRIPRNKPFINERFGKLFWSFYLGD